MAKKSRDRGGEKSSFTKGVQQFAKYSNLALEMGAIIFVFVFGGTKLDMWINPENKTFTIILSLVGVFVALFVALKDFIGKDNSY